MSTSDRTVRNGTIDRWVRTPLDELGAVERELWVVVVVTLFADVWLTHVGLQHGLTEANPVARLLIETSGIVALAAMKVGLLGLAGAARELLPDRQAPVIPAGIALPWLVAVLVNATLLLTL